MCCVIVFVDFPFVFSYMYVYAYAKEVVCARMPSVWSSHRDCHHHDRHHQPQNTMKQSEPAPFAKGGDDSTP